MSKRKVPFDATFKKEEPSAEPKLRLSSSSSSSKHHKQSEGVSAAAVEDDNGNADNADDVFDRLSPIRKRWVLADDEAASAAASTSAENANTASILFLFQQLEEVMLFFAHVRVFLVLNLFSLLFAS